MASESDTQDSIFIEKKVDGTLTSETVQPHGEVETAKTVVKFIDEAPESEEVLPSLSLSKDDSQENYRLDNFQTEVGTRVEMAMQGTEKQFQKSENFESVDVIESAKIEVEKQGRYGIKNLHVMGTRSPEVEHKEPRLKIEGGESVEIISDQNAGVMLHQQDSIEDNLHDIKQESKCLEKDEERGLSAVNNNDTSPIDQVQNTSETTVDHTKVTSTPHSELEARSSNDDGTETKTLKDKDKVTATTNDTSLLQMDLEGVKESVDLAGELKGIEGIRTSEQSRIQHHVDLQATGIVKEKTESTLGGKIKEEVTVAVTDDKIHGMQVSEVADHPEHEADTEQSLLQQDKPEEDYPEKLLREYQNVEDILDPLASPDNKPQETKLETNGLEQDENRGPEVEGNNVVRPIKQTSNTREESLKITEEDWTPNPKLEVHAIEELAKTPESCLKYTTGDLALNSGVVVVEGLNKDDDKVDNTTISNIVFVQMKLEGATRSKEEKLIDLVGKVTGIQTITACENLKNDDEIATDAIEEKNIDNTTPNDTILAQKALDGVNCIEAEKTVDLVGKVKEIEKFTTSKSSGIEHEKAGQSAGKVPEMIKPIVGEEQKVAVTVRNADHQIHGNELSEIVDHAEHESDTDHSILQKNEDKEYPEKPLKEGLERNETPATGEKFGSTTDSKEGEEGTEQKKHSHDACMQAKQAAATAESSVEDILIEKIQNRSRGIDTGDIKEVLLEEGTASSSALESSEAEVIKHPHVSEKMVEILKEEDRIREASEKGDVNALAMESISEDVINSQDDNYNAKKSKGEKLEAVKEYDCALKESNQDDENPEKLVNDLSLKHYGSLSQQGEIPAPIEENKINYNYSPKEAPTEENNYDENSSVEMIGLGNDNNDEVEATVKSEKVISDVEIYLEEILNDESREKPEKFPEIMTKEVELDALTHAEIIYRGETSEKVKTEEETAASVQQDNETGEEVGAEPKTEASCSNIQKESLEEEATAEHYYSFTVNETGKKTSEDDNGEALKLKEEFSLESKEHTKAMNLSVETKLDSSLGASELQKDHSALTTSEASDEEIHPLQNTKSLTEYSVSMPEELKKEILKEETQKKEELITSHLNSISMTKYSSSVAETSEKEKEEVLDNEEARMKDSNSITLENSSSVPEVSEKEIKQEILIKEESVASHLNSISMTIDSSSVCEVCKKESEKILMKEEPTVKDLDSTSVIEERDAMGLKDEKEENEDKVESFNNAEEEGSSLGILDTNLTQDFKLDENKDKEVLTFASEGENNTSEAYEKFPNAGAEYEKVIIVEANLDPISDKKLQSSIIPSKEVEAKAVEASKTSGNETAIIDKTTDEKADIPFTEQAADFESEDRPINQEGHSKPGSLDFGKCGVGAEAQRQGNEVPGKETMKHEVPSAHSTEKNSSGLEEIEISKKEITDNLTHENHAGELGVSEVEIPVNEASKHAKASTFSEGEKDILEKEYTVTNSEEKVTDIVMEEAILIVNAESQSQQHEDTNTRYDENLKEEVSETTSAEQAARECDLKEIETEKMESSRLSEEDTSEEYSKEDQVYKELDKEDPSRCMEKQNLKDHPAVENSLSLNPGETVMDTIREESEVKCLTSELKEPTGATDFLGEVKPEKLEGIIQSSDDNVLTAREKSDGDANIEKGNKRLVASLVSEVPDKEYKELSTNESKYIIVRADSEVSSKEAEREDRENKAIITNMEPLDIVIEPEKKSISNEENDDNIEIVDKSSKNVENEMEGKILTTEIANKRDFTTFEVLSDATVKSNIQESSEFPLEGHQFKTVDSGKTIDETSLQRETTHGYSEVVNSSTEQITGEQLLQKPRDVSILEHSYFEKKNTYEEVQKYGNELNLHPEKNIGEILTFNDLNSVHIGSEEVIQIKHDDLKNKNNDCSTETREVKAPTVLEEDQGHIQEADKNENNLESHDPCKDHEYDSELAAGETWDGTSSESSKNQKEQNDNQDHFLISVEEQILGKQLEESEQKTLNEVETEVMEKEVNDAVKKEDGSQNITQEVIVEENYFNDLHIVSTRLETIQELEHSGKVAEEHLQASISNEQAETTNLEDSTTASETTATKWIEEEKIADELSARPVNFSRTDTEPEGIQNEIKEEVDLSHDKADTATAEEITSDSSFIRSQMDMPVNASNSCLDDASSNLASELPEVNGKNAIKQIQIVDSDPSKIEEIKSSTSPVFEFDNEALRETDELRETTSRCLDVKPIIEAKVTAHPTLPEGKSEEKLQTPSAELPSNEQKCEPAITVGMTDATMEELDVQVHKNFNVQKEEAIEIEFSEAVLSTIKEFHIDRSSEVHEECGTLDGDTKLEPTNGEEIQVIDSPSESEDVTKKIIEETSKLQFETRAEEINYVSEIFECGKEAVKEKNERQKNLMVEKLDMNESKETSQAAFGSCLSLELVPVIDGNISAPDAVPVGKLEEKEQMLPSTFPTKELNDQAGQTEENIKESERNIHENSNVKNKGTKLKVLDFELESNSESQKNSSNEVHEEGHGALHLDTKSEPYTRQEIKTAESPSGIKEVTYEPIEENSDLQFETRLREIEHVLKVSESEEVGIKETDETQKKLNVEKLDLDGTNEVGIESISEDMTLEPSKRQEILVSDSPPGSKEVAGKPIEAMLDLQFKTSPREIKHVSEVSESKKEGIKEADEAQQNLIVGKLDLEEVKESGNGPVSKNPKPDSSKGQEIEVSDSPSGSKELRENPIQETADLQFETRPREIEHVSEAFESKIEGVKEVDETLQSLDMKMLDPDGCKEAGIGSTTGDTKSETGKRQEIRVADSPLKDKEVVEMPIGESSDPQLKTSPRETEHISKVSESEKEGIKEADEAKQNLIVKKLDLDAVKEARIGVVSVDTKSEPSNGQEIQAANSPSGCKEVTEKPIEENLQFETKPREIEQDSKVSKFEKGIKEAQTLPAVHLDGEVQILSSTLPHEDGINENTEEIITEVKMQSDEATKFKISDFGCVLNEESPMGSSNKVSEEGRGAVGGHTTFEHCATQETQVAENKLFSEDVTEKPVEQTSNIQLDESIISIEHVSEVFESKNQNVRKEDETQKSIILEKLEPGEIRQPSQGTSKSTCLGDDSVIRDDILPQISLESKLEEQLQAPSSALSIELEDGILIKFNEKEETKDQVEMESHEYLEMQTNVATELKVFNFGHLVNKESLIASSNEVPQEKGGSLDRGTILEPHKIPETHVADPISRSREMEEKTIEEKSYMQFERNEEETEHASEAFESKNQVAKESDASEQCLVVEKLKQHEIEEASQVTSKSMSLVVEPETRIITYETIPKEKSKGGEQVASSTLLPHEQEHGIGISIQNIYDNVKEVDLKIVDSLSVQNEEATELKVAEVGLVEIKASQMYALGEIHEEAQDVGFVLEDEEVTEKTIKKTPNRQLETSLKPFKHVVEINDTNNKAVEEVDDSQQSLTEEKLDQGQVKETSQITSKSKCSSVEPVTEDETTAPQILHVEESEEQPQIPLSFPTKQHEDRTEIEVKKTEANKEVEMCVQKNADDQMDGPTNTEVSEAEVELNRETQLDSSAGISDNQGRTLDGDSKSEKGQGSEIVNCIAQREKLIENLIGEPLGHLLGTSLNATNYAPEVQIQEEISKFDNTEIKEKRHKTDITYLQAEEDQPEEKIEPNIAVEYTFLNEEVPQKQKEVSNNPPSASLGKEANPVSTIVNEDGRTSETSKRNEQGIDGDGTVEDGKNNENFPDEAESKDVKEAKSAIDFEDQSVNTNSPIERELVLTPPEKKPEQGVEILQLEGRTESAEIRKINRDIQEIEEMAREISEKKPSQDEVSIGKTKTTISTGNEDVLIGAIVETPLEIEGQETKPEKSNEVVKEVEYGDEINAESPREKTAEQSITADWDKVSIADLMNRSTKETLQASKGIVEERELAAGKEERVVGETQDVHDGHARADEEKDEDKENEHNDRDLGPDAPVVVEASKDIDAKITHKKSHNILSGVGSKVKHSISKVKKAITGKSSHQKVHSPK